MARILYVEDNVDTANIVKTILGNVGHNVELAYTGKECFDKLGFMNFDLILLDIMLPDMNGWEIYGKLRDRLNAKYVFLSAIPISSEMQSELMKKGFSDYILKPFSRNDLIERVHKVLA